MRFLILTQYFYPEVGAPQVRLAAIIRHLLQLGHAVEVVTALPNYPSGKIFSQYRGHFYRLDHWEGITVHRVWLYPATGAGLKRVLNYTSFMFTALWGLRQAQKPDYVFVESPPLFLGITAVWKAQRWQVPLIFNVADLWPDSVQALGLLRSRWLLTWAGRLEQWLYRKATYINAVTEGIQRILVTEKKVPAAKILFLPNGVDTQVFKPQLPDIAWKAHLGLPTSHHIILYTGTHGYAHGMEVILHAAALLANQEILFLLVGDGSEKAALQQLCAQLKLNNVLFWPPQPVETIARLYSLARAGISTLRDNPLFVSTRPAKILAIMACAQAVIYSGQGEGAQLIEAAQAGIVVAPQDPQALAAAIQRLVIDEVYAEKLGHNGRRYVEKHLQWSVVVDTWLKQLTKTQ